MYLVYDLIINICSFERNDVESLHFYHNSLMHFFQSELYTNVKITYSSRQWFENVQMHLCTFTVAHVQRADAFMHNFEWI